VPRRNQYLLLFALLTSLVCYHRAGGAHGRHYGAMADAFITAMSEIHDRYLYTPAEHEDPAKHAEFERKLFEGALGGMVSQLEDRNSAFMGQKETKKFREELEQKFGGIGIEVSWDRESNTLTVLSPIVGTPAYEMGMTAGDKILKIDDDSTADLTLPDAVQRLRGMPGEAVRLTVLHEGESEPVELSIRRAIINVDTVLGDVRRADGTWDFVLQAAPQFGYIRITHFGEKTTDEVHHALAELRSTGVKGLIIDLRGNPGGLLKSANDLCNQFLSSGVIVTTQDRDRRIIEKYEADGTAAYTDWPIAVLIDDNSASASEIVAACLQDHDRAVIVGQRSYGKGTVQTPIELEGGQSILRLTIAGFWRPNDKNIHRKDLAKETDEWGVSPTPGYEVKPDDDLAVAIAKQRRRRDALPPKNESADDETIVDPVLEKALEYLRAETVEKPQPAKAA